jgi:hypothetical protein
MEKYVLAPVVGYIFVFWGVLHNFTPKNVQDNRFLLEFVASVVFTGILALLGFHVAWGRIMSRTDLEEEAGLVASSVVAMTTHWVYVYRGERRFPPAAEMCLCVLSCTYAAYGLYAPTDGFLHHIILAGLSFYLIQRCYLLAFWMSNAQDHNPWMVRFLDTYQYILLVPALVAIRYGWVDPWDLPDPFVLLWVLAYIAFRIATLSGRGGAVVSYHPAPPQFNLLPAPPSFPAIKEGELEEEEEKVQEPVEEEKKPEEEEEEEEVPRVPEPTVPVGDLLTF